MAGAGAIKAGEAYVEIGTRVDVDKGLRTAQAKLNKFGNTMLRASRNFAMASVAILAPLALAAKASTKFGTGMANISTMLDKTSMDMLPRFNRGLKELAISYGEATDTLQKGLYDILSASVAAGSAMNVLEASAKAARAGLSDTGTAADALTTILNSYKLEARDAGDVSDWFFGVVKRGKTTFAELGPSIGLVASDAAQAGLSLEEMGAALATMTRSGIRTEQAVTRLRAIINAFISPEKEAQKAALKFGLELSANTLKTIGLRGVLQKLQGARIEDVAAIFRQVRALSGMNAMIGGTAGFLTDYDLLLQRSGATEEAFAKQTKSLQFQFDQLKASVKVLAITVGEQLTPTIAKASAILKKMAESLKSAADAAPIAAKSIGALGVALGGLSVVLVANWAGLALFAAFGKTLKFVGKAAAFLLPKFHALVPLLSKVAALLVAPLATTIPILAIPFMKILEYKRVTEDLLEAQAKRMRMETRLTNRIQSEARKRTAALIDEAAKRQKALEELMQKQRDAGILTGISKGGFPSHLFTAGESDTGLAGPPNANMGPLELLAFRRNQAKGFLEANEDISKAMSKMPKVLTAEQRKDWLELNAFLVTNIGHYAEASDAAEKMGAAIKTYLPYMTKIRPDLFRGISAKSPQTPQVSRGLASIRALSGATTAQLNRPGQGRMRTQPATEATQKQMASDIHTWTAAITMDGVRYTQFSSTAGMRVEPAN